MAPAEHLAEVSVSAPSTRRFEAHKLGFAAASTYKRKCQLQGEICWGRIHILIAATLGETTRQLEVVQEHIPYTNELIKRLFGLMLMEEVEAPHGLETKSPNQ